MATLRPEQEYTDQSWAGERLLFADLRECVFTGCDFEGADLTGAQLGSATFVSCNLSNIKLAQTRMFETKFRGCRMIGVDFRSMKDHLAVEYSACILDFCTFARRNLKGQRFDRCSLRDADFSRADLTNARFSTCELVRTIFEGAKIKNCDFRGSSLAGIVWNGFHVPIRLGEAQLRDFVTDLGVQVLDDAE